jgi:hypothetical protein
MTFANSVPKWNIMLPNVVAIRVGNFNGIGNIDSSRIKKLVIYGLCNKKIPEKMPALEILDYRNYQLSNYDVFENLTSLAVHSYSNIRNIPKTVKSLSVVVLEDTEKLFTIVPQLESLTYYST